MSPLTQSYVYGASTKSLIGDTIGVYFDKSAERWPAYSDDIGRAFRLMSATHSD